LGALSISAPTHSDSNKHAANRTDHALLPQAFVCPFFINFPRQSASFFDRSITGQADKRADHSSQNDELSARRQLSTTRQLNLTSR